MDLDDLGRTGQLDTALAEDRHQTLTERLELLHRVPDLADPEAAAGIECDVILESIGRKRARGLDRGQRRVVQRGCHARRSGEADKDAHVFPPWSNGVEPTPVETRP